MDNAIELSLIGALLALDFAMLGQFMIAQPIVTGTIFGLLLGDVQSGMIIGAMIQLLWIGVLPLGAFIPSDHTVTGGITACLALMLIKQLDMPVSSATVLALAVAIPAGFISGKLDILVRHINSRWNKLNERSIAGGWMIAPGLATVAGVVLAYLRNLLIYSGWLIIIGSGVMMIAGHLPEFVHQGLALAFWLLPTIALAVIIDLVLKEKLGFWIGSAMAVSLPLAVIWSGQLYYLMLIIMAIGAVVAVGRKSW